MFKKELPPVIPSKDMIIGLPGAPVQLVVFGDYESADTRALHEIIEKILTSFSGKVNFVFRHFPLTKIHQRAHKAAEAAIAAGQEVGGDLALAERVACRGTRVVARHANIGSRLRTGRVVDLLAAGIRGPGLGNGPLVQRFGEQPADSGCWRRGRCVSDPCGRPVAAVRR